MSVPFPVCSVEDVANLTASDVMNRVNLGYLQGNSLSLGVPRDSRRAAYNKIMPAKPKPHPCRFSP